MPAPPESPPVEDPSIENPTDGDPPIMVGGPSDGGKGVTQPAPDTVVPLSQQPKTKPNFTDLSMAAVPPMSGTNNVKFTKVNTPGVLFLDADGSSSSSKQIKELCKGPDSNPQKGFNIQWYAVMDSPGYPKFMDANKLTWVPGFNSNATPKPVNQQYNVTLAASPNQGVISFIFKGPDSLTT